ncbi:MAG: hypothetical protein DHS20C20_00060 [Ardenticatenaceae bacterium]|nr:MAG: hypothetical protein DHS20C20_00060 [Ardenticatenaceae bacterium]
MASSFIIDCNGRIEQAPSSPPSPDAAQPHCVNIGRDTLHSEFSIEFEGEEDMMTQKKVDKINENGHSPAP